LIDYIGMMDDCEEESAPAWPEQYKNESHPDIPVMKVYGA
jgi:hypothetical protein